MSLRAIASARMFTVEAEASLLEGDAADALGRITMAKRAAMDIPSRHGSVRQHLEGALLDAESWTRAGDLSAAASSIDDVRAHLADLEEKLGEA